MKVGRVVDDVSPETRNGVGVHSQQGVAEDRAEVLSLKESVPVRKGSFNRCVKTKDYSLLKPDLVENKTFCPGVGQVLVVHVKGPIEHEELVASSST